MNNTAWFINEDLGVYQYDRDRQQDDFPNDFSTPYDYKFEAEDAADAMADDQRPWTSDHWM